MSPKKFPKTKGALREFFKKRVQHLSKEKRRSAEKALVRHLIQAPEFQRARVIGAFFSIDWEIPIQSCLKKILNQGKILLLPKIRGVNLSFYRVDDLKTMVPGPYGLLEPASTKPYSLGRCRMLLIPAVALSFKGERLGRGGGYYDRLLRKTPKTLLRVGVAFFCQIVEKLPTTRNDQKVDCILTEKGWFRCTLRRHSL